MKWTPILSFLLSLLFSLTLYSQSTLKVPEDFNTIQAALDSAKTNYTILVSPGTYYENLVWPSTVDGIRLIGEAGATETIIDGGEQGHVIYMWGSITSGKENISRITLIQGFTIQNGYAEEGAGIFCRTAHPTFVNLLIQNNKVEGNFPNGAGMYCDRYAGSLIDCTFHNNSILKNGWGAGLDLRISGTTSITNCVFDSNQILGNDTRTKSFGGGLNVFGASNLSPSNPGSLIIEQCQFVENTIISGYQGCGAGLNISDWPEDEVVDVFIDQCQFIENKNLAEEGALGGGMQCYSNSSRLMSSTFYKNEAQMGGGISINGESNHYISNCRFIENENIPSRLNGSAIDLHNQVQDSTETEMVNCIFTGHNGPAFAFYASRFHQINLKHCSFYENAGGIEGNRMNLTATNCIFWNDDAAIEFQEEVHDLEGLNLSHCVVRDSMEGEALIFQNPELSGPDLTPTKDSPCIEAGTLLADISTDLNSKPRPLPENTLPDIGAIEIDQSVSSTFEIDRVKIADAIWQVYPNPASSMLYVNETIELMRLYSYSGQLVKEVKDSAFLPVDLLSDGAYLLILYKAEQMQSSKVIIAR